MIRGRRRAQVFAVEDTSAQLLIGPGPVGTVTVRVEGVDHRAPVGTGGGVVDIAGLAPDTRYQGTLTGPGFEGNRAPLRMRTVPAPPGAELLRLATVSDLHLGLTSFDLWGRMTEADPPGGVDHPERCLRAALTELTTWGAQRLVVKGDVTQRSQPAEWDAAGRLLGDLPIPVHVLPGNHDMSGYPGGIPPDVGAHRAGIDLHREVSHIDLPGIRLVLVDTTVAGQSKGRLPADRADAAVELLAGAPSGALVCLHHYLQRLPVAWFWPPGVPRRQASRFLEAAAEVNGNTLLTSGHTHRHRRREHGPLVLTEVGSPKDHPGTWAGYVVHEGGIRQVVRRVGAPDCQVWLTRTAKAVFGAWGHWSPGRLEDRCFTLPWSH